MKPVLALVPSLLLLAGAAHADNMNVPGDFPTLQEAIDAATDGDVIVIASGIYRENVTVSTPGLTIKGKKVTIDGAYAGNCMTVTANDVTIIGLTFMNGGPATVVPPPPADGEGSEEEAGGLLVTGTGALIMKVEARACDGFGIKLVGSGEVNGAEIAGCLGPGLVVTTGDPSGPLTTIEAVDVIRCGQGFELTDGPFMFERNSASASTGDGVHLSLPAAASNGSLSGTTTVSRLKLLFNGGTGLLIEDGAGSLELVEKCDITANGTGLDLSSAAASLVVTGNDIQLNREAGVLLKTNGATFDGNKVGRNTLLGILVSSWDGAADGSNLVNHNKFEANGGDGIHVTSGLNEISANFLKDNYGDGIQVLAGAAGNSITQNTVRLSVHDGIDNSGTDTLITNNTCKDSGGADLAGAGDGTGTVDAASAGNSVKDGTDFTSPQELELITLP